MCWWKRTGIASVLHIHQNIIWNSKLGGRRGIPVSFGPQLCQGLQSASSKSFNTFHPFFFSPPISLILLRPQIRSNRKWCGWWIKQTGRGCLCWDPSQQSWAVHVVLWPQDGRKSELAASKSGADACVWFIHTCWGKPWALCIQPLWNLFVACCSLSGQEWFQIDKRTGADEGVPQMPLACFYIRFRLSEWFARLYYLTFIRQNCWIHGSDWSEGSD